MDDLALDAKATDAAAVASVAAGDAVALHELYERYGRVVYSFAFRLTNDTALAEMCVQDVFVALWRRAADFDPTRTKLTTWLFVVARDRAIVLSRHRPRRAQLHQELQLIVRQPDRAELAAVADEAQPVAEAVAELPEAQLEVLRHAYFDGLSQPSDVGLDDLDAEVLVLVERSLPPVSPRIDLFDAILAEVQPEAKVVPRTLRRSRRRLLVGVSTGFAAVAAAVAVAAVVVATRGGGAPVDGRAVVTGASDPSLSGEAVLRGSGADGGTIQLALRNVPPAPARHYYEVWVLRHGSTHREAVGAFTPASPDVDLDLPLPGPGRYAAVDVSVERVGGTPEHSRAILAHGRFG
jgi:RNA polymerase sigma-70 factor (ECF subfamily)